jgi:hypothetical protein
MGSSSGTVAASGSGCGSRGRSVAVGGSAEHRRAAKKRPADYIGSTAATVRLSGLPDDQFGAALLVTQPGT